MMYDRSSVLTKSVGTVMILMVVTLMIKKQDGNEDDDNKCDYYDSNNSSDDDVNDSMMMIMMVVVVVMIRRLMVMKNTMSRFIHTVSNACVPGIDRLVGLVVKAFASGAEDPGFESRLRQDFSESSHTSDFKICTPVATLPGAWRCRGSTEIG